jgi:FlaA1/EpsC-like NDP-sugar epimerase
MGHPTMTELFGREAVGIRTRSVGEFLRGRAVLVTGAAGSIGSEICRQVPAFRPRTLIPIDQWENGLFFLERDPSGLAAGIPIVPRIASITDGNRLRSLLADLCPAVVVHAAARRLDAVAGEVEEPEDFVIVEFDLGEAE